MTDKYRYPGQELRLFEAAKNWKGYIAEQLKEFIRGDVLEVGAGISETTPYLMSDQVSTWVCLEPDAELLKIVQQRIERGELPDNCSAMGGTLDQLPANKTFDTVIYIDVLEHIEKDREEMLRAADVLTPGGNLIILSPAYQWLYNAFDREVGHCRRYTKSSLQAIAPDALELRRLFYMESAGIFLLMINKFLFRRRYPARITVRFWDRIMIPISKLADRITRHTVGKTIIGIWTKP